MTVEELIKELQQIAGKGESWAHGSVQFDLLEIINPATGEKGMIDNPAAIIDPRDW